MTNNQHIEYVKDTFEEYLSKKDHISASDIKSFIKSPRNYYYQKYENKKPKDIKKHYVVGSAVHEAIMEPHQFHNNYVVSPIFNRRTTIGKEDEAKWIETVKNKQIIDSDEMEMIKIMGKNALKNNTLSELLKDSHREISLYTTDEKTGLKIRLRPDILCKKFPTIVDIKTTTDSSPQGFKRDVYKFGYSLTDAFYRHFSNRENYVFCAIEKEAPYQISLFQLGEEMSEYGENIFRRGLDLLKWSYDNDFWCDYNEFEILKECYDLGNPDEFLELNKTANKISFLK